VRLPFESPKGLGGIVLDTRDVKKAKDFYEPFTGTKSWILREQDVKLPGAGRYYVVAYDPDDKPGKLWAALGRKEAWGAKDMLRMPKIITDVRGFTRSSRRAKPLRNHLDSASCLISLPAPRAASGRG